MQALYFLLIQAIIPTITSMIKAIKAYLLFPVNKKCAANKYNTACKGLK